MSVQHRGQPRAPYCGGDLLAVLSASDFPFSSFRVRNMTVPNPQKALKFKRVRALNESESIEKASNSDVNLRLFKLHFVRS